MKKKPGRLFFGCMGTGLLLLVIVVAIPGKRISDRVNWKSNTPHENQTIVARQLRSVAPEAQLEDDTCGLHTLRGIYSSYGLDPNKENLRIRLGIDVPANPVDQSSTGTLQPDMLRVLVQDGFDYELLDFEEPSKLIEHLHLNNMAALLIRRRENGHLHWVAAKYDSPGRIMILDSLVENPYPEDFTEYVGSCLLAGILVQKGKSENMTDRDLSRAHYDGVLDMMNTVKRYHSLMKRNQEVPDSAE